MRPTISNKRWQAVPLGEFSAVGARSIEPKRYPNEAFDLYSIPAYDRGTPDVAMGHEIGSAKKIIQTGDVLLSRIVPHIQRVWVVGPKNGRRQIASGEWIVYRHDAVDADYLRHALLTNEFHQQFLQTVAGVGGSLLRARPEGVNRIDVPLPDKVEQRRIAAILDKADAIRRKRRQALAETDTLLRSVFLDMFGDPRTNSRQRETLPLGDVCQLVSGNSLPSGEPFTGQANGFLLLKVADLNASENSDRIVAAREWSPGPFRSSQIARQGSVVFPKRGGAISTNKKRMLIRPAILDPNLMAVAPRGPTLSSAFLYEWFKQLDLLSITSGSAVPQLNKQDLEPLIIQIPSKSALNCFEIVSARLMDTSRTASELVTASEALFSCLSQRAFRGEL